ncbi:signal peptidase I [Kibdelosporangium phytohabitans]|uniref:Signal peptidase I n=1 Tax=Kibdelosporangium phytohabitans TaxID=860235 RepID=A0A0N9IE32_9PSEU|nr:signal peptidase I [Kibdelosporangium phytohabitans]ALG13026.1 signal peptidase I [Kibdelosporangium phytohabitans]
MVNPVHPNAPEDDPERPEEVTGKLESEKSETPEPGIYESRRGRSSKSDPDDESESGKKPKKKKMSFWKELPILIVVALVLVFLIQQFLARVYVIPSGSMEQTLHGCPTCQGDRILVEKVTYYFTDPAPGDVVVFKGPGPWVQNEFDSPRSDNAFVRFLEQLGSVIGLAPPDEKDFVKRVIATGGQTVRGDVDGKVYVNDKPLNEPYVYWEGDAPNGEQAFEPITVPPGALWVMGDNRNNSSDSRRQGGGGLNGVVPVSDVIGKAQVIVLPPGRWGGISDPNPQAMALAPAWQQGIPLGAGVLLAWPVLWTSRRVGSAVTRSFKGSDRK